MAENSTRPPRAPQYLIYERRGKIKLAAAELGPDQQYELFRWWTESDAFRQRQLAALKRDVAAGISSLDSGMYQAYDDSNVMQLAEDIGRAGRERLKKSGA